MKQKKAIWFECITTACIFLIVQGGSLCAGQIQWTLIDFRMPVELNETCTEYALRGGFLSWSIAERDMMTEDPAILIDLVNFYELHEGRPYWFLIAENWLVCGICRSADGRTDTGWQAGDLNLDGIVNLHDLKLYSRIKQGWVGDL